jgi:hypothetical protein
MKTNPAFFGLSFAIALSLVTTGCSFSDSSNKSGEGGKKMSFTLFDGKGGEVGAASTVTGCLTPGTCSDTQQYQIQGTGNLPNFHTAAPFFRSAFGLSASESPTLKKIENRVWDNIPNFGHPQLIGDTNGIALIQVAAGACNDFLEKGRHNAGTLGGLNLGQPPSANAGNWQNYVNNLTARLWGEAAVAGEEKSALDELRTKTTQAYANDTKKVAYLLCVAVASAPKGLIN